MKTIRTFFLTMALILAVSSAPAMALEEEVCAEVLCDLGLLRGSEKGFELERTPTRAETLVMLLRLIGLESEALSGEWESPFADCGWAEDYIGLAYDRKLANGFSKTEFGTQQPATTQQYATFLLRSLGYSQDDFAYADAISFFNAKTPVTAELSGKFTRGEMVRMSVAALSAPMKNGTCTLAEHLSDQGLFLWDDYLNAREKLKSESKADATVLMYVIGSDLETRAGQMTDDLREMLRAEVGDHINIVLQTGGTQDWRNDWMKDGAVERFTVTAEDVNHLVTLSDASMTHADTLSNFIRWGADAYPAERYILIFWDHGYGTVKGFGRDETADGASMPLDRIDRALSWADVEFDLVGFDACLMNTLTSALVLSSHADYLLASAEIEPLDGWHYTNWLAALSDDPDVSIPALAEIIAADYIDAAKDEDWSQATISLVNLAEMDAVAAEWSAVCADLRLRLEKGQYDAVGKVLTAVKSYGRSTNYDQFDLIALLTALEKANLASPEALLAALERAVLFVKNAPVTEIANGIGVYIPFRDAAWYRDRGVREMLVSCGWDEATIAFLDVCAVLFR